MITRTMAASIKSDLELAIQAVAKKYKMNLDLGTGSFSSDEFAIRVKFQTPTAVNKKETAKSKTSSNVAVILGLPENIVGYSFKHKTKILTVTGLNPSCPKNCVTLKDQNGKAFKCSAEMLKSFLKI